MLFVGGNLLIFWPGGRCCILAESDVVLRASAGRNQNSWALGPDGRIRAIQTFLLGRKSMELSMDNCCVSGIRTAGWNFHSTL
jgi:hypothetical protein